MMDSIYQVQDEVTGEWVTVPHAVYQVAPNERRRAHHWDAKGARGYVNNQAVQVRFVADPVGIPMEAKIDNKWRRVHHTEAHGFHVHLKHTATPILIVLR